MIKGKVAKLMVRIASIQLIKNDLKSIKRHQFFHQLILHPSDVEVNWKVYFLELVLKDS